MTKGQKTVARSRMPVTQLRRLWPRRSSGAGILAGIRKTLVTTTAVALVVVAPVNADVAVSITGGAIAAIVADSVHGWKFTVNENITLTHLGLWDQDEDGLDGDHPIGLFRLSDGALLTSGTMSAGTGDALLGGFRYIDVADVPLAPGEDYVLSYYNELVGTDNIVFDATGEVFAPEVNWVQGRFGGNAGGLILPLGEGTDDRYGPNFQFEPSVCPWDFDGNGDVGVTDLLKLLGNWGPCQ